MGKWPWVGREIIKYDTENVFNKKMGILGFITFLQRNMAVPGSPVVRTPYFQCRGPASILVVQLGHEKYMYIRWDTTSQFNYRMSEDNMVFSSIQSFIRVRLCDPMNCSTPGLPAHHQLPESTQTHVHRVSDAIQSSHPLSSPSPTLNLFQHPQSFPASRSFQMSQLFASCGQSIGVSASAWVLPMNTQDWSLL